MRRWLLSISLLVALGACAGPQVTDLGASTSTPPDRTPTPNGSPTPTASATPAGGPLCASTGSVTGQGGTLDCLSFAIVGDTRPPSIDDTSNYPKAIITKIYEDLESASGGRPSFAVATGDYQFSSPTGSQATTQIGYYLTAQSHFSGTVFHTMGNHECTGAADSNCTGSVSGNNNYAAFMSKMVSPLGFSKPYFSVHVQASDASWTAKFVFVAANAWDATQASWLQTEMGKPTTFTFVIRHEGNNASAPGLTPSNHIIAQFPYTLLLVGHTHTFDYVPTSREVVVGIGGAPLVSSYNYGYVMVRQRADNAIDLSVVDYQSGAVMKHFVVKTDGTPTT